MLWRPFWPRPRRPDLGQLLAARDGPDRRQDVLPRLVDVTASHVHKDGHLLAETPWGPKPANFDSPHLMMRWSSMDSRAGLPDRRTQLPHRYPRAGPRRRWLQGGGRSSPRRRT